MPTYEYVCTSCDNRIEVYQSFSDQPLQTCEICGGTLRRVFHPVGVLFKGTGFYSTDAKTKKTADKSKAPTEDGQSSESKSSESKKTSSKSEGSSTGSEKSA